MIYYNRSQFVHLKILLLLSIDGVTLCTSMEEVENTFKMLLGKTNGLGLSNATILVQEYLTGK